MAKLVSAVTLSDLPYVAAITSCLGVAYMLGKKDGDQKTTSNKLPHEEPVDDNEDGIGNLWGMFRQKTMRSTFDKMMKSWYTMNVGEPSNLDVDKMASYARRIDSGIAKFVESKRKSKHDMFSIQASYKTMFMIYMQMVQQMVLEAKQIDNHVFKRLDFLMRESMTIALVLVD